jgi:hypothetical protein
MYIYAIICRDQNKGHFCGTLKNSGIVKNGTVSGGILKKHTTYMALIFCRVILSKIIQISSRIFHFVYNVVFSPSITIMCQLLFSLLARSGFPLTHKYALLITPAEIKHG